MEDRRAAFPTHDPEPEHNILDGSYMRTENDPIEVVHKRYWALLVVGVLCIGLFSFYSPVGMMRALHCDKTETDFVYILSDGDAISANQATELSAEGVTALKGCSTTHMVQKDADFSAPGIFVYPAENTNYALYATENAAYVFAVDQEKYRYQVKDDNGALYQALLKTTEDISVIVD